VIVTDISKLKTPTLDIPKGEDVGDFINAMLSVWEWCKGHVPEGLVPVGLAANQCGLTRSIILVQLQQGIAPEFIINPIITKAKGRQYGPETCLSLPGKTIYIERNQEIKVRGMQRYGFPGKWHLRGLKARIVQHEIDHLRGKVITDYEPTLCKV